MSPSDDYLIETLSDNSLDLERALLPKWLLDALDDQRQGLYHGFLFYGNVDDLFPFKDKLYRLEEYLSLILTTNIVIGLDPSLGSYVLKGSEFIEEGSTLKLEGIGNEPLNKTLQNIYKGKQQLDIMAILNGGKHWLHNEDPLYSARLVRRILEFTAQTGGGPGFIILSTRLWDISTELVASPYVKKVEIPFPDAVLIQNVLDSAMKRFPTCMKDLAGQTGLAASRLNGVGVHRLNNMLVSKAAKKEKISMEELEGVKQALVEETCEGLIEFIDCGRKLDDLHGMEDLKGVIRRDLKIWEEGNISMMPKGYLLTGPVGTGKTFFVETLGGEASIPVVKLNNFRAGNMGDTEANLEKIFRMLKSMSRCFVFIDEADQAMGSRQSGSDGSAGRIYSMFAQEISSEANRGRIIWIMATSQPHKLEPDLKRPGRIDLKIPLLPAHTPEEAMRLIMAIAKSKGLDLSEPVLDDSDFTAKSKLEAENKYLYAGIPKWLTPASATVIVDEIMRKQKEFPNKRSRDLLQVALRDYLPLIPIVVMQEQTRLAVRESSDMRFVPKEFQYLAEVEKPYIIL